MERRKLSDILAAGTNREQLNKQFADIKPAGDFGQPLPKGEYIARIVSGELFNSRSKNTPGYKLAFEVLEGDHKGRKIWHDLYLSAVSLPYAKRDLTKLGVKTLDQLDLPLPPGIRCCLRVAIRPDEDGSERNRVLGFEVIGIDVPEWDSFAPPAASEASEVGPSATPPSTAATASGSPAGDESSTDSNAGGADGGGA